jgi:hypothetical protein
MESKTRNSKGFTGWTGAAWGFLSFAFVLACAGCCTNSTLAKKNGPAVYKVAFENEKVLVIEYCTGSEKGVCGYGNHTHPGHVCIMLADAKLRTVTPDGREVFEASRAGEAGWKDAEEHICENLSGENVRCYVIEIKDKDWEPSTGLAI